MLLCAAASLAIGSRGVPLAEVVGALTGNDGSDAHAIVRELRVPRTELGLLVGAALGGAGALMQGVTRNPLADPGILGINAGAAFAVVLGDLAARRRRRSRPTRASRSPAPASASALRAGARQPRAGAGRRRCGWRWPEPSLATLLVSLTSAVLRARRPDARRVPLLDRRLDRRPRRRAWRPRCLPLHRARAGDRAWRRAAGSTRWRSATTSRARSASASGCARRAASAGFALLAGGAVAAAGPIAFVGLAVPHVARALVGPDYRWLVPYSIVLGAALLLAGDVLGRVVARPAELEVGHRHRRCSARPFFIWLVRRRRLVAL